MKDEIKKAVESEDKKITEWFKELYQDRFKRYLVLALLITGIFILIQGNVGVSNEENELVVHFYFHPLCHFCELQKPVNEQFMEEYPDVEWIYHDIANPDEAVAFRKFASEHKIPLSQLGTPVTVIGDKYFIGFNSEETPKKIRNALEDLISGEENGGNIEKTDFDRIVQLPVFGEIDVMDYSLPFLAVVLGLVDGFNPCAMWVLVYLISLIMTLNDKKKIWLIVGSFVFASGVLYFLFMTAWLNVFLLIGYLKPVTLVIGLFALGIGILDVKNYIQTKGNLGCKVVGGEEKKRTMEKIKEIVNSPLTIWIIVGIIGLAFVVNSVEFVCSAALPAIFTQVLALSNLSGLGYYGYILLYVLFFMLDDLIIFSLAAFAVNSVYFGNKYAKYCKLIGGVILIILGVVMVFFPEFLR